MSKFYRSIVAVASDIDGTLIKKSDKYVLESRRRAVEECGKDIYSINGWDDTSRSFLSILNSNGLKEDDIKVISDNYNEAALDEIDKYKDSIKPFDGIEEALNYLKGNGYLLGIISNGLDALQMKKLNYSGLDKYFNKDLIVISSSVGYKKPSEDIYKIFIDRVNSICQGIILPNHILFIDDRNDNINAAKKVGMRVALPTWSKAPELKQPTDLINLLINGFR